MSAVPSDVINNPASMWFTAPTKVNLPTNLPKIAGIARLHNAPMNRQKVAKVRRPHSGLASDSKRPNPIGFVEPSSSGSWLLSLSISGAFNEGLSLSLMRADAVENGVP